VTTAADTNVLLDVLASGATHHVASREALGSARAEGAVVICEVVLGELGAAFSGDHPRLSRFLGDIGVELTRSGESALVDAGRRWRRWRAGGGRRDRILADFLIGAHAVAHADRLLTRDRGFYRRCFEGLRLVEPGEGDGGVISR